MSDRQSDDAPQEGDEIPLGQRLYDNWILLMIAGLLIMGVIYTGWGLWEITSMPEATLP
jgi:hypothetical protein